MWDVADQNESPRPTPPDANANLPAKPHSPEIVDAEVVESHVVGADVVATEASTSRPQQPADDAEFREYQQFLEFQKFREWQQSQGGDATVPPTTAPPTTAPPTTAPPATKPKKPWWKTALRLLRFKLVRRLIYVLLAFLLIPYAIDYYFSGGRGSSSGGSGAGTGESALPTPIKATDPQQAVRGVYNYLGYTPEAACAMFDDEGKRAFAAAYGVADCATAARQIHAQVTNAQLFTDPRFGPEASVIVGNEAQVLGCRMQVSGGPLLGSFKLTKQTDGGWAISAYSLQTPSCGG